MMDGKKGGMGLTLGMLAKNELVDEEGFAKQEVEVNIAAGVYTLLLRISHFAARDFQESSSEGPNILRCPAATTD